MPETVILPIKDPSRSYRQILGSNSKVGTASTEAMGRSCSAGRHRLGPHTGTLRTGGQRFFKKVFQTAGNKRTQKGPFKESILMKMSNCSV